MSKSDEGEKRAEAWLRAQGYEVSPAGHVPGRNPDFWAEASNLTPPQIWAEVKSTDQDDSMGALTKVDPVIKKAAIPPGLRGHAILHIEPHAAEQSIRRVLKAFKRHAPVYAGRKIKLAFVQQARAQRDMHRVEIDGQERAVVWVWGAGSGALLAPLNVCDESFAPARMIDAQGNERLGKVFEFFEWTVDGECSLVVHLDPGSSELNDIGTMSGGSSQACGRTARVLKDANEQLSSACNVQAAPGIVLLTPRELSVGDMEIQMAIYGSLTVAIRLDENRIEYGDTFHGQNGVFHPGKNRHISAAVHVRRDGSATFFPNPFALYPIADDASLFRNAKRANVEFT